MYRLFRGIRWVEQEIPDYMALLLRRQCSSQLLPWKLQSDIKIITVMGMEYGVIYPCHMPAAYIFRAKYNEKRNWGEMSVTCHYLIYPDNRDKQQVLHNAGKSQ